MCLSASSSHFHWNIFVEFTFHFPVCYFIIRSSPICFTIFFLFFVFCQLMLSLHFRGLNFELLLVILMRFVSHAQHEIWWIVVLPVFGFFFLDAVAPWPSDWQAVVYGGRVNSWWRLTRLWSVAWPSPANVKIVAAFAKSRQFFSSFFLFLLKQLPWMED